jgi:hypothetical protein
MLSKIGLNMKLELVVSFENGSFEPGGFSHSDYREV